MRRGGRPKTEGSGAATRGAAQGTDGGSRRPRPGAVLPGHSSAQAPARAQPPTSHAASLPPHPRGRSAQQPTGHALSRGGPGSQESSAAWHQRPPPPFPELCGGCGPSVVAEGTGGTLLGRGFRSLTRGTAQTVASASGQVAKCPESCWPPSVPARAGAQPRGGGRALPPGILTPQWLIIPR